MGVADDLVPDTTSPYRGRTLAGNVALGLGFVMIVFVTTGFLTPNWVEVDLSLDGTQFEKLGLWVHCFNSYDLYDERFFVACRWIFNPDFPLIGYTESKNKLNFLFSFLVIYVKVFYF